MKSRFTITFAALTIVAVASVFNLTAVAQCGRYDLPKPGLQPQSWFDPSSTGLNPLVHVSDGDDATIVGFWRVTLTSKGNTGLGIPDGAQLDHGFAQWHSDGTEIMNSNRQPSTGSFCLGVWKKIGASRYKLNHFALGFDDGVHQNYANIREEVVLSKDGDSFSGVFVIANYDLQGNPGPVITGEITGTRVKLNTTIQDVL